MTSLKTCVYPKELVVVCGYIMCHVLSNVLLPLKVFTNLVSLVLFNILLIAV